MKKILSLLLVSVLMFSTVSALAADKVGVAMPTQSLPRWVRDGDLMKTKLEAAGFEVDLQFANNDVATQVSQLENMISGRPSSLASANQRPNAVACSLPSAESGTSTSR